MKNYFLIGGMMLCVSMCLPSCKKQITEPIAIQPASSIPTNSATQCRPAVLGVYAANSSFPDNGQWTTLAQKWYVGGKVKYLKAVHGGAIGTFPDPILDFMFDLNWGEVTYEGNQIYLRDVANNLMKLRVTLDDNGRPAASYYDYVTPENYMHDTTYYYYDGDRLDNIISFFQRTFYSPRPIVGWRKYVFSYDDWGNLVKAEFPESERLNLEYDYSKPVEGVISNFHITSSLKLLEYLELIKLPMHHALTRTDFGYIRFPGTPSEFFSTISFSVYKDYVITDGLVRSYKYDYPGRLVTFYNGWECGTGQSVNATNRPENNISTVKEFQQLYPGQR